MVLVASRYYLPRDSVLKSNRFRPQELAGKEQEKLAEVTRVKVELQEQIGHLQAERTAQSGLKEKIAALEREIKGKGSQIKVYCFIS